MGKFRVLVECRNEGGTDLHCWSGIEDPNGAEAEHYDSFGRHNKNTRQ